MLTTAQFDQLSTPITDLYESYNVSVINDIARRLAKLEMTQTAAWQMQRLIESGKLYETALDELTKLTGQSEAVLREMFEKAGVKGMRFDDSIYKAGGLEPLPLNLSPAMAQVLAAGLRKTQGVMHNLTMTTAIDATNKFQNAADLAYMQITSGAMSYDEAIRAAIKDVASQGLSTINFAGGRTDQLDVAMRRAVLTGVGQTTGNLTMARADEMGCDLVQTSAHIGARPEHEEWQGQVFSRSGKDPDYPDFVSSTGYGTGEGLGGWNCVLGETLVSGPTAQAAYRREYSGEIITLKTAGHKELTVTPNHPILTSKGWIASGLLQEGDDVICRALGDRTETSSPHNNERPTSIENVFDALRENGKGFVFLGSPENFHGDGSNGEVDVIFSNSFLRNSINAPGMQQFIKTGFGFPSGLSGAFVSESTLDEVFVGARHSPNSIMGGLTESLPRFRSGAFEANTHGLGSIRGNSKSVRGKSFGYNEFGTTEVFTDSPFCHAGIEKMDNLLFVQRELLRNSRSFSRETQFSEAFLDYARDTTEVPGDVRFPHSTFIELDKITFIERKQITSTHVYNLETENGWYFANGIITHNCRHTFFPFFKGISENAYTEETLNDYADKTVTYNEKDMSVYEATQKQRAIEREIRLWKRQAGALEAAKVDNLAEVQKVKYWQAQMRRFVNETGLDRQRIREQI